MYIQAGNLRMFYREEGQGIPLVLIHGFPLDHTIWDALVPELARVARVITPDLRGHGQTEATQGAYTMDLLAEDIRNLLDALGVESAVLVGHSMGGYASLAFAKKYPERLAGLGLVSTQAAADTPERRKNRFETAEEVSHNGVGFMAESLPPRYTGDARHQQAIRQMILQTSSDGVIGSLLGMADRPDRTAELMSIHVPAWVTAGSRDELILAAKTLEMCAYLPHAACVEIEGSWHMPMMENPQRVAEGLVGLVKQIKT